MSERAIDAIDWMSAGTAVGQPNSSPSRCASQEVGDAWPTPAFRAGGMSCQLSFPAGDGVISLLRGLCLVSVVAVVVVAVQPCYRSSRRCLVCSNILPKGLQHLRHESNIEKPPNPPETEMTRAVDIRVFVPSQPSRPGTEAPRPTAYGR